MTNLRPDEQQWLAEAEAATPGPWHALNRDNKHGWNGYVISGDMKSGLERNKKRDGQVCEVTDNSGRYDDQVNSDITFIASSRTAVPALCQRISELSEALRERMEKCECQRINISGLGIDRCGLCRKTERLLEGRERGR